MMLTRNQETTIIWVAIGTVVTLILFGLAWTASALFDSNVQQERDRYQTCLNAGGSYQYDGNTGSYSCTSPLRTP